MEPFQFQIAVVLEEHVGNDGNYLTAPAGKRMVIEHASVDADPNTAADYYIVCTLVDTSTFIQFPS